LDTFERATGIRLKDSIEEIEIATPETFANFNGKYNGCIYGYEVEPWDSVIAKSLTINDADENPIKGLRFAGGFSRQSQGFSSSYKTGEIAGRLAAADCREAKNNG